MRTDESEGEARDGAAPSRPTPRPPSAGHRARPWILGFTSLILGLGLGGACGTCLGVVGVKDRIHAGGGRSRVGVVELKGPITESKTTVEQLRSFALRSDLLGLVLRIDSPGGAVSPSQEIFDAVRWASSKKPVVASMASVAASGGFWAALGADYVFASPGSVTGSIGVLTQAADLRGIAELARVRVRTFKSGHLKDAGNPFREMTAEDEALFMSLVRDIFDQFVAVTAERRKLPLDKVLELADGRVMTGRAALEAGLVDELGGLHEAARKAASLATARDVRAAKAKTATTAIVEDPTLVYPREPSPKLFDLLMQSLGRAVAESMSGFLQEAHTPRIELR